MGDGGHTPGARAGARRLATAVSGNSRSMIDDNDTTQQTQEDDGPQVHTSAEEGHPAGEGERSDRDVGGPTSPDDAPDEDVEGGGPSKTPEDDKGFDSHE